MLPNTPVNQTKIKLLGELIMKKASKETRREQRYNANLHKLFLEAQKEINANE